MKSLLFNENEYKIIELVFLFGIAFNNKKLLIINSIIFTYLLFFYRYKTVDVINNDNLLISPCTGKIMKIEDLCEFNKIYIFLSPMDNHTQIIPYSGKIVKYEEIDGKDFVAYKIDKNDNKRNRFITEIETSFGNIEIIQNTGLLAKRIKNFKKIGDNVKKGDLLGMIKFGSRVDIKIPKCFHLKVKESQKIKIGEIISEL
jgi:phosphatidylserine decarboxylase